VVAALDLLDELKRALGTLATEHSALVSDVHARLLSGTGLRR